MKSVLIKRKGYVYILVFFVFLSFGAMLRIPQLIFFTLPLIVYVFIATITFKNGDLEIKREISNKILFEKEEVKLKFIIRSKNVEGIVNLRNVDIEENFFIKDNEEKIIEKNFKFEKFGKYDYSRIYVSVIDKFGIFNINYDFIDNLIIRVYPVPENLRKFSIKPKKTRTIIGDIQSKYLGQGSDFYAIREFQIGDDPKRINWKRYGMLDDFFVNEYLTEKSGNAVIIMDARKYQKSYEEYKKMLQSIVKATMTVSTSLVRSRTRLGLVILKDTIDWVYPGYGREQLLKINERILNVESKFEHYVPMEYGKRIVTRFFPPNSFIIIIGTLFDKDIIDIAFELVAKKYEMLIIIPYVNVSSNEMVSKIVESERKVRMRIISKYATVIDWDISKPLTKSMEVLKR